MEKVTKESFLSNVAEHQLEVLQDNGLYRHLKVRNPKTSNHWYQITTWPDYLCISGDMGCFTFSRVEDMFRFFRSKDLEINPHYYAEKLQAGSYRNNKESIYLTFDIEKAKKWIRGIKKEKIRETSKADREDIHSEFESILQADNEYTFYAELRNLDIDFDIHTTDYSMLDGYYLWCLFAIVHAINLYDQSKQSN